MKTTNTSRTPSALLRSAGFGYAVSAYVGFLASFGYFILRTMGYVDRWEIGAGVTLSPLFALAANAALIGIFAVQHTVMARPRFKRLLTRLVPQPLERATFVWASNIALGLASYFWVGSTGEGFRLWHVTHPVLDWGLWSIGLLGWLGVAGASFLIDHFELFGLRQAWCWATQRPFIHNEFKTPGAYRVVRHPMMLAMLVGMWASGEMSAVRLSISALMTLYVFFGVRWEERDLVRIFGERYVSYARRVPQLFPRFGGARARSEVAPASQRISPAR